MTRNREEPEALKVGLAEQAHLDFIELLDSETSPAEAIKPKKTTPRTRATAQATTRDDSTTTSKTTSTVVRQPAVSRAARSAPNTEQPTGLVSPRTGKARVFRGKKHVISVSIAPHVLARVDAWAARKGMSRPAAIAFALDLLPE